MIIKKFQGKTEEEALEAAKKELGSAVVVMNVKNVKKKGIFSIFKPQLKEVTVALEEETSAQGNLLRTSLAASPRPAPRSEMDFRSAVAAVNEIAQGNVDLASKERRKPQAVSGGQKAENGPQTKTEEAAPVGNALRSSLDRAAEKGIEEKLDNLQSLIEKQMKQPEEERDDTSQTGQESEEENGNLAFFKLLYSIMLENEIDEKYANQLIDDLDKSMKKNMPVDFMLATVYQKMVLKFGQPSIITPSQKGPKILFFIGPTGVGKTTTIAKIASKFRVEQSKKIALLTADTYRIAAAEQLRTYANILEVPFRVVYASNEIEMALQDFKDYDYILVDTAGHSHHNENQRENMSELIHSTDYKVEKEVYLVVSATTKYRDLLSIADTYQGMTEYKLIFTKLDETTTLGNMLNLKLHTGAAMSYITCGQNVPDDIREFNPQETVKLLLGGNHF